jgi:hypothetical protein
MGASHYGALRVALKVCALQLSYVPSNTCHYLEVPPVTEPQ